MARHKKINLKRQMLNMIEQNFAPGGDKHSDKRNGGTGGHKIYSHADRAALVDTSALFCNWVKQSDLKIEKITDIKVEHVQRFLNEKSANWSNATLNTHLSRLNKLDRIFEHSIADYEKKLAGALVKPACANEQKCRSLGMTREDFSKLTDYAQGRRSHLKTALEVAGMVGLRVSEISKLKGTDYDPKNATLSIVDSKGKRSREIIVPEGHRATFEKFRDDFGSARLCPVQYESLNQALNRAMRACDLEQYIESKTGFHSIRKMIAQEMYDDLKETEGSKNAWNKVSNFLGHGEGREDLFKSYILNP